MEYFDTASFSHLKKSALGFTLIEMVVVVAMIGILFVAVALLFNPAAQIAKAQNATRQHDLEEIRTAVDTYYDDTGCYPTSLSFGHEFSSNGKIYMTKIPEDPNCQRNGTNCYVYQTDVASTCPQWNVLYAQLATPVTASVTCPLTSISGNCVPINYQTLGINYCVVSGTADCGTISSVAITPVPPIGGGSGGTTPTQVTPTPTPAICGQYYACTGQGSNGCNILDTQAEQSCTQNGGSTTCYCDSHCLNQCQ